MNSMSWSKAAEDQCFRPGGSRRSFMPVRKAMSGIFRSSDRVASASSTSSAGSSSYSSPQSVMTDGTEDIDTVAVSPAKRRKRISFRRSIGSPLLSPASVSSVASSTNINSADYFSSKETKSRRQSRRASGLNSWNLFPYGDAFTKARVAEEDDGVFVPPQRPSCPAPFLNLSPEECQLVDNESHCAQYLSQQYAHLLRRVSQYPSDESFYCKGLEDGILFDSKITNRFQGEEPAKVAFGSSVLQLVAPNAMKLRPRTTFLSIESDSSSPLGGSECSMMTASEGLEYNKEITYDAAMFSSSESKLVGTSDDMDLTLFCPSSPKPIVQIHLLLPPSAPFNQSIHLRIESNASILELKESLCSTLYRLYDYRISATSIGLSLLYDETEQPRRLENDRPLYGEGVQDDDEILVHF